MLCVGSKVALIAAFCFNLDRGQRSGGQEKPFLWQLASLSICILIALAAIGIGIGEAGLNQRDNDEGVYWQSLRALSAGYHLYGEIFCSQPPFFLFSIYPFYASLGSTIVSARIGVAIISVLGVPGAYLMGTALAGRAGGIAAIVALIGTPMYLSQSQVLQAEGPATALLFVSVGAAFMWWRHPTGRWGTKFAALCGVTVPLGILIKLFDVTAIVPILLLVLAHLWRIRHEKHIGISMLPIVAGIAAALITALIVLAPFLNSLNALARQVLMYHLAAHQSASVAQSTKTDILRNFFATNEVLTAAAVLGAFVTILRRDWRMVPLLAWLLTTLIALESLVPLFSRHAIALIPPLIGIVVLGLDDLPPNARSSFGPWQRRCVLLIGFLVLAAAVVSIPRDYQRYRDLHEWIESPVAVRMTRIAGELEQLTTSSQWIITDTPFSVALANRDTPPWLADTSLVRKLSGYLTSEELLQAGSNPRTHAVVLMTDRFSTLPFATFHSWVEEHFQLLRRSDTGVEVWIR
jgi:4-amino-4-deoxy-L-arabinose transferase-like glycosyltransferase